MIVSFPTARTLLRQWRTTTLVVLSISLAIAANSTIVSLLEALIYPKMDMAAPDRLYWVNLYGDYANRLSAAQRDSIVTSHGAAFTLATWQRSNDNAVVLERGDRFTAVTSVRVGQNFFDVARIAPVLGRGLAAQDTNADPPAVVVSRRVVAELFGGEPPVGQIIRYQGAARRVVGVLGDQADFPNVNAGVWSFGGDLQHTRYGRSRLIRIRDGYTRDDVARSLDTAGAEVAQLVHERFGLDVAFRLRPATQTQFHYENFHYAIAAACVALLLIACANAANLELSRVFARRRQLAIKSALGASPSVLVLDVLKEQLLLAGTATAIALAMTYAASRVVYRYVPRSVGEFVVQPHIGWRVVTVALLIAAIAMLLVGCAPAMRSARADPQEALKAAAGTGRSHRGYYAFLGAVELGLAIALTCGGIVMMRATMAVDARPLGYDVAGLIQGSLRQQEVGNAREAMETLRRRLESVTGVASAAVTLQVPVRNHSVTVEDSSGARVEVPAPQVRYLVVTPGYLETLGIPITRGSDFDPAVVDEPQVILDGKSAARLWPGRDPVGQRVKLGGSSSDLSFARVVGVITEAPEATTRHVLGPPLPEHTLGGIFYLPGRHDPLNAPASFRMYGLVARAQADPAELVLAVRRALIRADNASFSEVQTMDDALGISRARASRRFLMQLFAFFAICGVAICGIAVFSIVSRTVIERRRELSVRRALGAQAYHIMHVVLREMVPVSLLGVALGLALTKYAIPLLGSQALSDDRFNAPLYAAISILVIAVLGLCVVGPTFRATRVPTHEALRAL